MARGSFTRPSWQMIRQSLNLPVAASMAIARFNSWSVEAGPPGAVGGVVAEEGGAVTAEGVTVAPVEGAVAPVEGGALAGEGSNTKEVLGGDIKDKGGSVEFKEKGLGDEGGEGGRK